VVALLEQITEIEDASAVYLIAVVIVAWIGGTAAAIGTAVIAFLIYDLLFTEPRFSLVISDTSELLNLVLVLIVAIAVGRLAALGRERAAEAERRATEATGLFAISRLLATTDRTESVAAQIVELLARDASLERAWIGLDGGQHERILADTGSGPVPTQAVILSLVRTPGDEPARWIRAHDAVLRPEIQGRITQGDVIRVRIETGGVVFGSLWGLRTERSPSPARAGDRPSTTPDAAATRLLSLAADQIALGLRRDRLRQDATTAEVARRSDALKSALLDSVSHDLRTPLASIRASAGNLADPAVTWSPEAVREAAETIDLEAQRLDRFVRSVLDMSRIDSGTLRPDLEFFDAGELVRRAVERLRPVLGERPVTMELAEDAPLIEVDAVLFDAIVANILDNVAEHTASEVPVAIEVAAAGPDHLRVTVEDGGAGVAEADLPRLFEKFHRANQERAQARRGMGIGLSIVRGMTEAMGGTVTARRSGLGGLAIDVTLPAAAVLPPEAPDPTG
jgi:two-component system sensor histidine kinase KdpD